MASHWSASFCFFFVVPIGSHPPTHPPTHQPWQSIDIQLTTPQFPGRQQQRRPTTTTMGNAKITTFYRVFFFYRVLLELWPRVGFDLLSGNSISSWPVTVSSLETMVSLSLSLSLENFFFVSFLFFFLGWVFNEFHWVGLRVADGDFFFC